MPSDTTVDPLHPFSGPVKALTATSDGTLYAGGRFGNLENIPAADNVAYLDGGGWHAHGLRRRRLRLCDGRFRTRAGRQRDQRVRRHRGIERRRHRPGRPRREVGRVGVERAGLEHRRRGRWFPPATNIYDLASVGTNVFATGTFQNANGDGRADNIAFFDGTSWHPVGSNGAGNGPWVGEGSALALVDRQLYAAGNFTSAGGDPQAQSVASFSLTQIIAYPTPTVTQGPSADSRRPR